MEVQLPDREWGEGYRFIAKNGSLMFHRRGEIECHLHWYGMGRFRYSDASDGTNVYVTDPSSWSGADQGGAEGIVQVAPKRCLLTVPYTGGIPETSR